MNAALDKIMEKVFQQVPGNKYFIRIDRISRSIRLKSYNMNANEAEAFKDEIEGPYTELNLFFTIIERKMYILALDGVLLVMDINPITGSGEHDKTLEQPRRFLLFLWNFPRSRG